MSSLCTQLFVSTKQFLPIFFSHIHPGNSRGSMASPYTNTDCPFECCMLGRVLCPPLLEVFGETMGSSGELDIPMNLFLGGERHGGGGEI